MVFVGLPDLGGGVWLGVAARFATNLLLGGVFDGIGELVEGIAHLRCGNVGRCVLKSLCKSRVSKVLSCSDSTIDSLLAMQASSTCAAITVMGRELLCHYLCGVAHTNRGQNTDVQIEEPPKLPDTVKDISGAKACEAVGA